MPTDIPEQQMLNITLYDLADFYKLPFETMRDVINCESGWNKNAINKNDPNGGSHGLLQFQSGTFNHFANELGLEEANPYNPYHALEVGAYMWSIGLENRWSCTKMVI
jgi:soluble lytic murein transglycosylase-like protein